MRDEALVGVLHRARDVGLLGPGPIQDHLDHASLFISQIPDRARFFVDLGSGGGVPGLVIARARPDLHGALLEGSTRRAAFLSEWVERLDLADRIAVWAERAELAGHHPERRGSADLVVSRSFGPPAVVCECAAPLLRPGGHLVVSDPPSDQSSAERWPDDGVQKVGLRVHHREAGPPAFTVLEQSGPCPDRYPRRVGIPAKRPLF